MGVSPVVLGTCRLVELRVVVRAEVGFALAELRCKVGLKGCQPVPVVGLVRAFGAAHEGYAAAERDAIEHFDDGSAPAQEIVRTVGEVQG
jgi:hypothetical protein